VVVVTYRSAETIEKTLLTVARSKLVTLVVVDNASDDDTVERVRRLGLTSLKIVVSDTNYGFGPGCNRGARESDPSADLLLFLNPDAVIEESTLTALVEYMDEHPSCGLVAPRLRRAGEDLTSAGRLATTRTELRYLLPPRLGQRLHERRFPPSFDRSGPVPVVEGACMLVRRRAFAACGGFDEDQFLYFEEHHLARALARLGYSTDLNATVVVDHLVGASTRTLGLARDTAYIAATVRYLRRDRGAVRARCYVLLASVLWRLRLRFGDLPEDRGRALLAGLRRGPFEASA
jgi:GT2 family glycosyltransferase